MQHFVNEYEYTTDVLEESVGAWWDCKFKNGYRSMLVVSVLIVVLSFIMKRPAFLLTELAPLFVIVLFKYKKRKSIQIEKDKIDVLFQNLPLSYHVEIGENIIVTFSKGSNCIQFSDVEKYIETQNLIILIVKGSMTLALYKKGFKEGTEEEFKSLLASKIR